MSHNSHRSSVQGGFVVAGGIGACFVVDDLPQRDETVDIRMMEHEDGSNADQLRSYRYAASVCFGAHLQSGTFLTGMLR